MSTVITQGIRDIHWMFNSTHLNGMVVQVEFRHELKDGSSGVFPEVLLGLCIPWGVCVWLTEHLFLSKLYRKLYWRQHQPTVNKICAGLSGSRLILPARLKQSFVNHNDDNQIHAASTQENFNQRALTIGQAVYLIKSCSHLDVCFLSPLCWLVHDLLTERPWTT